MAHRSRLPAIGRWRKCLKMKWCLAARGAARFYHPKIAQLIKANPAFARIAAPNRPREMDRNCATHSYTIGSGIGTFPPSGGVTWVSWTNGGAGSLTLIMPDGTTPIITSASGFYAIGATGVAVNTMTNVVGWW